MTDAQRKQRAAAGRASAAASRKLHGEESYKLKMREIAKKGGRPSWQRSLEKARERMLVSKSRGS